MYSGITPHSSRSRNVPTALSSAAAYTDWSGRVRTSPYSPDPQPGSLTTASGRDDAVDVSHRQELPTRSGCQLLIVCRYARTGELLLLWAWVWACPSREPTRCSRLADYARHPGAAASRVGSEQRPRAARAEAARAGRWWRWFDYNGVTVFFVQLVPSGYLLWTIVEFSARPQSQKVTFGNSC